MYHAGDYIRLLLHRGKRKVFWCGSDIKNLEKSRWQWVVKRITATHICENEVERDALEDVGITASILPQIFSNPKDCKLSFHGSRNPHIWLCAHEGYEDEYGVTNIERLAPLLPRFTFHIYGLRRLSHGNILYHGKVTEEQFNKEIKQYQASIRFNLFDGFSEVTAKSVLMGQYPISRILYPNIGTDLRDILLLPLKKKPNKRARNYWLKVLTTNMKKLLYEWE